MGAGVLILGSYPGSTRGPALSQRAWDRASQGYDEAHGNVLPLGERDPSGHEPARGTAGR